MKYPPIMGPARLIALILFMISGLCQSATKLERSRFIVPNVTGKTVFDIYQKGEIQGNGAMSDLAYWPRVQAHVSGSVKIREQDNAFVAKIQRRLKADQHRLKARYPDFKMRAIIEVIAGYTGVHPKNFSPDEVLQSPWFALNDQLDVIEIYLAVAQCLHIEFTPDEIGSGISLVTARSLYNQVKIKTN